MRFTKEGKNPVSLDEFFQAGVHLGHRSSRWEPRMAPFLLGSRKGLDVIDLDKTLSKITLVFSVLKEIIKNGGNIVVNVCQEMKMQFLIYGKKLKIR